MKKIIFALLIAMIASSGLSAKSLKDLAKGAAKKAMGASDKEDPTQLVLTSENALYAFLKGTKADLKDEYLPYVKVIENDVYRKYHNDPFEWEEKFTQCKKNFDAKVANLNLDKEYMMVTVIEFGDYDFDKQGYKISISDSTYFPLEACYYVTNYAENPGNDSYFKNDLGIKIQDLDKHNFLAMDKNKAKIFLQGRKYSSGNINKKITISFKYKIGSFDSKEYNTFAASLANENKIPLIGIIQGAIEVIDQEDNYKKIGELTINK